MNMKSTAMSRYPDSDHDTDLKSGMFSQTSTAQLATAFGKFWATESTHLCVFFYGGLVSSEEGLQTALALGQPFRDAGAYRVPVLLHVEVGLLTEICEFLQPHQPIVTSWRGEPSGRRRS